MARVCLKHGIERVQRYERGARGREIKAGSHCPKCAAERTVRNRTKNPETVLDSTLWSYHRIRLVDFRRLVVEQEGRCKACGSVPASSARGFDGTGLVIDHDHACCPANPGQRGGILCGKCIRGLLCSPCNIALGLVRDDPDRLHALLDYLDRCSPMGALS